MARRMTLGTKLISTYLLVGIIPLALVGIVAYIVASDALEESSYSQLTAMRDIKQEQIRNYFSERHGDMTVLVDNVITMRQEAFTRLKAVQDLKRAQVERLFTRMHGDIKSLSESKEAHDALDEFAAYAAKVGLSPEGGMDTKAAEYKQHYDKFYSFLEKYVHELGYYDVFLIDNHGRVVFTEAKESDLGANLRTGELREEGLGEAFAEALASDVFAMADFESYSPSAGAQAAFMAHRVTDAEGNVLGVAALQLPDKPILEIVQDRTAMGVSGETYLVGKKDSTIAFRSNMLTMGDGKYVIGHPISTPYIESAIAGQSDQAVFTDSSGTLTMVTYDPLNIEGLHWAIVTKINLKEAIAPAYHDTRRVKDPDWKNDFLSAYVEQYGYYDLFLIHPEGHVFYSVAEEKDYNTNMLTGPYKDSGLGQLVRQVKEDRAFGFSDFRPYAPSNNEPASFIAEPVVIDGKTELIVALQLSSDAINGMVQQGSDKDRTLEAYLVGSDGLMRSDSVLNPDTYSLKASFAHKREVHTAATKAALAGESGAEVITDYLGSSVLSAYTPIDVFGTRWVLLCEIDEAVAFHANQTLFAWCGGIGLITAVLVAGLAVLIARGISGPIARIIMGLSEGADQVAAASNQISESSQSLAEGATEQAASLEETSSALEEMASMSRQNADNAGNADTMMRESNKQVSNGSEAVNNMAAAMNEINDSSDAIGKIIKTIEEIAFQTNLLALNAAVEAARAGDAGKGFAVVADEVRNLAQRAGQAARDTAELIEGTVTRVKRGTDIVGGLEESFKTIEQSSTKIASLVAEITSASSEQAEGVDQVNTAVAQMDKVTQSNAANSEEAAAAAEELSAQAVNLRGMVCELSMMIGGDTENTACDFSAHAKPVKPAKPLSTAPAAANRLAKAPKAAKRLEHHEGDDFSEF